ncbi:MAG: hypothetical protein M1114_03730 [Candidatus Dependentiae bacterium]|nr:hypothetical protein [Candidatus Dependentiae bacterium]
MNIKRTISLLLLLQYLLCGNSIAMDYPSTLMQKLKKVGAWYEPEPALDAPLDEGSVTASVFWRSIKEGMTKNVSLSEQDENEIGKVCGSSSNNDNTYHVQRFNLAAALYLGINPKCTWMQKTLCDLALRDDCPLVALMLEKGCDPNIRNLFGESVIFRAKTVAMAELLRSHGANLNVIKSDGGTLLHNIFTHSKTYALIPYYIKYGVNPLQQDRYGQTALEEGITYHRPPNGTQQNIIDRVAGFLEAGVSEDDILAVGQAHQAYQPFVTQALELYYKNK